MPQGCGIKKHTCEKMKQCGSVALLHFFKNIKKLSVGSQKDIYLKIEKSKVFFFCIGYKVDPYFIIFQLAFDKSKYMKI